ncbi:MAG: hypothetical protein JKY56_22705 [Kofleriaceae bacterium]|nr:hypothetical protein [Kofleriaceae bacterium]
MSVVTSLWGKIVSVAATLVAAMVLAIAAPGLANAQPSISQSFGPTTIGPGSVSILRVSLSNGGPVAQSVAFVHGLPAGLQIADPAIASSDCPEIVITAPPGGSTLSISGGRLGTGASCSISVGVSGSIPGAHQSSAITLMSDLGSSVSNATTLNVDASRVSFSAAFSPSSVSWGDVSTLTYTVSAGQLATYIMLPLRDSFSDFVVADPSNFRTTCMGFNSSFDVVAGASVVSIGLGQFPMQAIAACTVSFDVQTQAVGPINHLTPGLIHLNTSFAALSAGHASAALEVTRDGDLHLRSEFIDDPVLPGNDVLLRFTISNFHRNQDAYSVAFDDVPSTVLPGLIATGLPINDVCGVGSQLSGTGTIMLTGATIAPQSECEFDVIVSVPGNAPLDQYFVTSTTITGEFGGGSVNGNSSSAPLFVQTVPLLIQSFSQLSVVAGDTATLAVSITNTNTNTDITEIEFANLLTVIPQLPLTLPVVSSCGPGASLVMQFSDNGEFDKLSFTGGSLAPGASCNFNVVFTVPLGTANGSYTSTINNFYATSEGRRVDGTTTVETLEIVAPPHLYKSFNPALATPGATVTLQYQLRHDKAALASASDIAFADDLSMVIAGLVATNLPLMDVCGSGSQLTGTSELSFVGGSLLPGESCVFEVTLMVPAAAVSGDFASISSPVTALIDGNSISGAPGIGELSIANIVFSMDFLDDPVRPGQAVALQYSIENIGVEEATGITFSNPFSTALIGLQSTAGTVMDVCGAGSQFTGTSLGQLSNGSLAAGATCSFTIPLLVPGSASPDSYTNSTSALSATVDGSFVLVPGASDTLLVADPLLLAKSFASSSAGAGQLVRLRFTLANADSTEMASSLSFTDDLETAFPGLIAVGLPLSDVCGVGSEISGTSVLSFSGGSLGSVSSCTFDVMLQLPSTLGSDTQVNNVTSALSGLIDSLPATAEPATATLDIDILTVSLAIAPDVAPSGTTILTVTINNELQSELAGIRLSGNLDSALAGLQTSALPADGFCGANSTIVGGDRFALSGASLAGQDSCTFDVELSVPAGALPGDYQLGTSDVSVKGVSAGPAVSAILRVLPHLPGVSALFTPSAIAPSGSSLLVIEIDNSANQVDLVGVSILATLPDGLSFDGEPTTTCTGGAISADMQTGILELLNGSADLGGSCRVEVSVAGDEAGNHIVPIELGSAAGQSPTLMALLRVWPTLGFSLAFIPSQIEIGQTSVLEFKVGNPHPLAGEGLSWSAALPEGLTIVSAQSTCGGTLDADPASPTITLTNGTVAAQSECIVSVLVVPAELGGYAYLATLSSQGGSQEATAGLVVIASSNGGCCSTANTPQKIPIEIFLVLGVWVVMAWRRRREE